MGESHYLTHLTRWFMSSPMAEWAVHQVRELLIGALSQGPIPQHVAFEMDGNRRYARSRRIETVEGHHHGFEALARVLEICYKCGVKVVTIYAFSIENYNRPAFEVNALMQLAKTKLEQLAAHGDILDRYGARVRVIGQRSLIREDVLEVAERAEAMTANNKLTVLNICFPYTSREEMTSAVRSTVEEYLSPPVPKNTLFSQSRITQKVLSTRQLARQQTLPTIRDESPDPAAQGDQSSTKHMQEESGDALAKDDKYDESAGSSVKSDEAPDSLARSTDNEDEASSSTTLPPGSPPSSLGRHSPNTNLESTGAIRDLPNPETITEETLDRHLYTAGAPPLDIFIRTSGVERLSDFMLWQCHKDTHVFFLQCFWPEFDLWHFIPVLLEWQWRQKRKAREEKPAKSIRESPKGSVKVA